MGDLNFNFAPEFSRSWDFEAEILYFRKKPFRQLKFRVGGQLLHLPFFHDANDFVYILCDCVFIYFSNVVIMMT